MIPGKVKLMNNPVDPVRVLYKNINYRLLLFLPVLIQHYMKGAVA